MKIDIALSLFTNHVLSQYYPNLRLYLPSSKPFKCPLCWKPDRDQATQVRHYAFGHQKLISSLKLLFKIFAMFKFLLVHLNFLNFLPEAVRIVATCWLREMIICAEQIYLLGKATALASHCWVGPGWEWYLGWKCNLWWAGGGKCNIGIITEK